MKPRMTISALVAVALGFALTSVIPERIEAISGAWFTPEGPIEAAFAPEGEAAAKARAPPRPIGVGADGLSAVAVWAFDLLVAAGIYLGLKRLIVRA